MDFKQLKIWKRLKNKYKESKVQEYITFFTVVIEWNQINFNNLETASLAAFDKSNRKKVVLD